MEDAKRCNYGLVVRFGDGVDWDGKKFRWKARRRQGLSLDHPQSSPPLNSTHLRIRDLKHLTVAIPYAAFSVLWALDSTENLYPHVITPSQ